MTPLGLALLVGLPLVAGAASALLPRRPAHGVAGSALALMLVGLLVTRGAGSLAVGGTELALTAFARLEVGYIAIMGLLLLGYHYVAGRTAALPALLPPLAASVAAGTLFTRDLLVAASFLQLAALVAALLMIGEQPEWGASLAGAIYLVLSALGGMALLFAFVLADVQRLSPGGLVTIQFVVATLTVGLGLQWGAAPLYAWVPNAFQRAGPASTTLAISLIGPATLGLLLQALSARPQLVGDERVNGFLTLGGVATAAFGAVAALAPGKPRRALGYLLVSDLGYVLVGMSTYSRIGVSGAALHMAHRGLMALILLAAAHELEREAMDSSQPAAPYSWGTLLVGVLALIGVPPLAGFAANWAVLQAASLVDWRLTAALAITSAVALAAGLAAVGRLRGSYPLPWRRPSPVERYLMALTALAALWGLAPGPALRAIHEAVSELAFVRPF